MCIVLCILQKERVIDWGGGSGGDFGVGWGGGGGAWVRQYRVFGAGWGVGKGD